MVFDNIFNFANKGTGNFSVDGPGTKPKPGVDDFEDADEDAYEDTYYEDTHGSLFSSGIHGASSKAKVLQQQSPEARNILRFIGDFIGTTQRAADQQREHAKKPESVSEMASAGMEKSSETMKKNNGDLQLQKDDDLKDRPKKSAFTTPTAPKATAEAAPTPPKATAEPAPAPPKATAEPSPKTTTDPAHPK
jgi:hypothetical protein